MRKAHGTSERLIMLREPDLAGLFDLRSSEADEWIAGVA